MRMMNNTTLHQLQKTPFLNKIDTPTLEQLITKSTKRKLDKKTPLFHQGEKPTHLYVILDGWVKVAKETQDGKESIIQLLSKHNIVGETNIFQEQPYGTTAETIENSIILEVPENTVKNLVTDDKNTALTLLEAAAYHINQVELQLEHLESMNAAQRIGCFLLRQCIGKTGPTTITLPREKAIIAAYLHMQPETFSRALKKLQEEAYISTDQKNITINNIETLQNFACISCSRTPQDCSNEQKAQCQNPNCPPSTNN